MEKLFLRTVEGVCAGFFVVSSRQGAFYDHSVDAITEIIYHVYGVECVNQ